jgi:NADPH:quinone reductase-like Zn-dependent oxidoreductase
MRAIVHERYGSPGDVLRLREVDKPVPTGDGVLVRVRAASTNGGDPGVARGRPHVIRIMGFGLFTPRNKIMGDDVAGRVEAGGDNVERFKPGDEVFGFCTGAFAEYVCTAQDSLAPKPPNITFEQAAASPSSAVAVLQGLRDQGQLQSGQKVLINGASGGVGTFAVQMARLLGAEVTAVCSTKNVDTVRSLGADHVIDYTREDFTGTDDRYDLMLDVAVSVRRQPILGRSLPDLEDTLAIQGRQDSFVES